MATNFNMIFTDAFLLVLICSYGIMSTEGRLLTKAESHKKHGNRVTKNVINSGRMILEHEKAFYEPTSSTVGITPPSPTVARLNDVSAPSPPAPLAYGISAMNTDDFRPTEPGHSPGAGHSHGPGVDGPN